jgi:hypothetical protein
MTDPVVRFLSRFTAVLIVVAATGCDTAPRVRPVSARPVVVAGVLGDPDAAGFLVDIDLENVGTKDIPLERFDYAFEVQGVGRFEGRWAAFLTLPPGSVKRVTIPASMPLPTGMADRVDLSSDFTWSIDGGLRYQAPGLLGRILFDAGIRRPSEPFSGSGTFRVDRPAQTDPARSDPSGGNAAVSG